MTKSQRVRYEMFLRLVDFWVGQMERFPATSIAGTLFERVRQAAAQIEADQQARLKQAHAGAMDRTAARMAVRTWMTDMAQASRGLARLGQGKTVALRVPGRMGGVHLLAAARMFFDAAQPLSRELIELGLDANWESGFKAAIQTFEASLGSTRAVRHGVVTANAGIKAALADGLDAARSLDLIVTLSVKHDPVLLAAWKRSRRVVLSRVAVDAVPADEELTQAS